MKPVLFIFVLIFSVSCAFIETEKSDGSIYYLDPVNGSFDGDGSLAAPWPALSAVLESELIRSHYYENPPWDENDRLKLRNPDGPVSGGDTLVLLSGDHGAIVISQQHFLRPLTIAAADGHTPEASSVRIIASSNIILKGLNVHPYTPDEEAGTLVSVSSHNWQGPASDVTVADCFIYSAPDTSSWNIDDWNTLAWSGIGVTGDRITVENNSLLNVNFGISYTGDFGTVKGNTVANFAGDGLRGIGNDLLFEGNLIKDNYNVNDNHDDGFQSWSLSQYDQPPRERVTLRGNTIINCTDPDRPFQGGLQGIGCFDGFFTDWVVENNLILVDHWHGITFLGATGITIRNNTVVDMNGERPGPSWIMIGPHKDGRPSSDCLIQNNIAHSISMDSSFGLKTNNYVISSLEEVNQLFTDPQSGDFSLKEGSPCIDAGRIADRAIADISGRLRPKGKGVDIGAYESH